MTFDRTSSELVLEQAAAADELTLRLAAASWRQMATEGATWFIRKARRDSPTINRAAGADSKAVELALEHVGDVLDLSDRLVLSAIEAARWAAVAAAVRPWAGTRPRSLLTHQVLDAVAAPWQQAICVRGQLAGAGPEVEQLACALLVDGWGRPVSELPPVVAALLAR